MKEIEPTSPEEFGKCLLTLKSRNFEVSSELEDKLLKAGKKCAYFLGIGIAMVIDIFNPSLIVLAGGVFNFPGIYEWTLKSTKENSLENSWNSCKIEES